VSQQPRPYREEDLRQALATDPRVGEPELQVRIAAGRVIVTGALPSEERRRAVEDVVRERCGELQVDNQTTVPDLPPGGEEAVT
jgi:osmotically-inducible protein OsmY